MNNCSRCSATLIARRSDWPYAESGLSHVTLTDVEVRECTCGEMVVVIPRLTALHRAIAHHLVHERRQLEGVEIQFLRKFLDWTPEALASRLGLPTQVQIMWEDGFDFAEPFAASDRLLRVLVLKHLEAPLDLIFDLLPNITGRGPLPALQAHFVNDNWGVV